MTYRALPASSRPAQSEEKASRAALRGSGSSAIAWAGLLAVGLSATSVCSGADLRLTGKYTHTLSSTRSANPSGVLAVSGRRSQLSAAYVRTGSFGGGGLTNYSPTASSYLSIEFLRKPFIGATSSEVLFSRAYYGLAGGASYPSLATSGRFKSPGRDGVGSVAVFDLGADPATGTISWTFRSIKYTRTDRF